MLCINTRLYRCNRGHRTHGSCGSRRCDRSDRSYRSCRRDRPDRCNRRYGCSRRNRRYRRYRCNGNSRTDQLPFGLCNAGPDGNERDDADL